MNNISDAIHLILNYRHKWYLPLFATVFINLNGQPNEKITPNTEMLICARVRNTVTLWIIDEKVDTFRYWKKKIYI